MVRFMRSAVACSAVSMGLTLPSGCSSLRSMMSAADITWRAGARRS
ncbi:Uncharacterised protein [Mycobacteroides abscessus subsp. abscessus]|nr:Uncharacterised protein [Mycobacteroides abscessus subsp. abscessus]